MGFLGLPPPNKKPNAGNTPPAGAPRPQQAGGKKVATSRDWRYDGEGTVGRMDRNIQAGAEGVRVSAKEHSGSSGQGYLHGLGMGAEPTGTPFVATKDANGNDVLCRVEVDQQTGEEILVPMEGGNKSDPIAGRCVAVWDPNQGREVMCRIVVGRDGKDYYQEIQ